MATRWRTFTQLRNAFHRQIFDFDKSIFYKQHKLYFSSSSKSGGLPTFSKAALLIGSLGFGGGLYGYLAAPDRKTRSAVSLHEKDYVLNYEIPDIKPSREVSGPATDLGLDITLYQYQTCPFCCKVRAFLDFHGIPYKVIEVHPVMRQQIKFSSYKKVPILIVKERKSDVKFQLNDSTAIISILATFINKDDDLANILKSYVAHVYKDENGKEVEEVMNRYSLMYGSKTSETADAVIRKEKEWRKWADTELVHILSPNIYRSFGEALHSFNYFSEVGEWQKNFSTWGTMVGTYIGATAMYFIGKRLKKKYRLKEDERQSLYDACNHFTKAIGTKQKFLGGDHPNLADLAVYGLFNSIEGCLAFQDVLDNTNIGTWYSNVKEAVAKHAGYQHVR